MLASMSSADFVHTKGLGSALWTCRYLRMACSSSRVDRWVPRRMQFCVSVANQRSTWLSYQWWTNDNGTFIAFGIHGQVIHVDPSRGLVIAVNRARLEANLSPASL